MSKHDRLYKCEKPGCKMERGFTTSGGLSRHVRDVHGKGLELMCPYPGCTRSLQRGFKRKDHLNVHLRRVHKIGDAPRLL